MPTLTHGLLDLRRGAENMSRKAKQKSLIPDRHFITLTYRFLGMRLWSLSKISSLSLLAYSSIAGTIMTTTGRGTRASEDLMS